MEEGNKRKGKLKEKCRTVRIDELELMIDKTKFELLKRRAQHSKAGRKAYTNTDKQYPTIKDLKKDIAVMMTILKERTKK